MQNKIRLDKYLVDKAYCRSRNQAQELISLGCVEIRNGLIWRVSNKASTPVDDTTQIRIADNPLQNYVSRAALKLLGAIAELDINLTKRRVVDIGQSTGGFTQVLLEKGVAEVVGIEVGRDQLAASLRHDPRVICLEGVNARDLTNALFKTSRFNSDKTIAPHKNQGMSLFDMAVVDVSFISQALIVSEIRKVLIPKGEVLALVKPQFESGPSDLTKNGIVRNPGKFGEIKDKIISIYTTNGFRVLAYLPSTIKGSDGNHEFFIYAKLQE